jgi:hypothetical protein
MLKPNPRYWLVPAAALSLMGCPDEELAPLEPCTVSGVSEKITQSGSDQLDLLFVIDNSGSMEEEQDKLEAQLTRLVRILTSGDLNQDGDKEDETDFEPVGSLHLGVVSSNMGTLGQLDDTVPSCKEKGDDGVLLDNVSDAQSANPDCAGVDVSDYMKFETKGVDDVAAAAEKVANDFSCVAVLGIEGCGLEQQLEAMLKAVVPGKEGQENLGWDPQVTFAGDVGGHGDGKNEGFVRTDAVLAIIHVSDEEDCSITEKGKTLFSQGDDQTYNGPDGDFAAGTPVGLNFKCANATDSAQDPDVDPDAEPSDRLLQPAQRFIDGLKALKPDNPDRIIFAGIVGIPEAAESMTTGGDVQDFAAILEMDEMQVLPGENNTGMKTLDALPRPACTAANGVDGSASPARRFVQVAAGFGENAIVRSICSASYEGALTQILTKISKKLTGACLPSALNPDAQGVVKCDVVEILGKNGKPADCLAARGRKFKEMRDVEVVGGDSEPRVVCDVNQVAVIDEKLVKAPNSLPGIPDPLVGWYYDNYSNEVKEACPMGKQQRIATTANAEPTEGASFAFECFNPVGGDINLPGKGAVGAPCDPANSKCESDDDYKLSCEPTTKTCQITCKAESGCPDGWVCDAAGEDVKYCINPKCPPAQ